MNRARSLAARGGGHGSHGASSLRMNRERVGGPLRRRIAAFAIGLGLLPAAVGAAWPAAAWRPTVEPEPVVATMLSREVSWRSAPTQVVRIELLDGGDVVASADGVTGSDGWFTGTLSGGPDPLVRPDRSLRAGPAEGPTVVGAAVPNLSVQLLQDRYELTGDAPPGIPVRAVIGARGLITTAATTANESGRYAMLMPAGFTVAEGASGYVEIGEPDGLFRAAFEGLTGMADIGGSVVRGRATRGGLIQALVTGPNSAGSELATVEDTPTYSVTLREGGQPYAIRPGDRVSVLESGRTIIDVEVPEIELRADLTGAISGWSKPGSTITVEAHGTSGWASTVVRAGGDGLFSASLSDELLFAPGTVVSATTGPQLRFRRSITVTGATVQLNGATVTGVITPGVEARASLLGLDGRLKASGLAGADSEGRFVLTLLDRRDMPSPVREGEELVLGLGPGLPIRSTLPPLAAYGSPVDDVVAGTTWPSLRLHVAGSGIERTVSSDSDGVFVADFRPDFGAPLDIVPGTLGQVAYVYPHLVVSGNWVAPAAELTLSESAVTAIGIPGLPLTLTLMNGTSPVAAAGGEAAASTGMFDARLRTSDNQPVTIRSADELLFEAPRFTSLVSVPELTVAANRVTDSIVGSAPPGALVRLTLRDGTTLGITRANASGRYGLASAAVPALGDSVGAEILARDLLRLRRVEPVRRTMVNLDTSQVTGWGARFSSIQARLKLGHSLVGLSDSASDADGAYVVTLLDGGADISPGLELSVSDGGPGPVTAIVPELELDLDTANLTLTVTGPPGAPVVARFASSWGPRAGRETRVVGALDASGTLLIGFPPGLSAEDGPLVVVELDESGVTWVRAAAVPYLEAQSGGTMVRGREEPGSDVLITARRGALEIGSAGVVADATGAYTVVLQTAPGMVLARGDQVTAVGRPPAVVAPLSLSLDEGAARATGSTGGGESVELAFTDVDGDSLGRSVVTAGGDGAYDGPVGAPAPLAPGILGEAVVAGEAWGRTFALDYVPRLVVRIGSSTVRGLADPFGEVAVTAGAPGGQATGTALADTRGQWEAELVGGGSPVAVQPGWQVHVVSEGGPDVDLEVPAFGVRLLDKGLITGWAPPSAEVRIRLTGPGGVSFEAGTRAGLDGTWVLRESELSGAVPFPLTQTTAALASIDVRGHRVEAHTDESPEATPTPTSRPQPGSPTATRTSGATPTATPTSRTRTPTATGTATGHRPVVPSLFVPSVRAP